MLKTKIATGIATASILALSLVPAVASADTTVNEQGNGAGAVSNAVVNNNTNSTVVTSNTENVTNTNNVNTNTGGNTQSFNNGGSTNMTTGSSSTDVTNTTSGGTNAVTAGCGCTNGGSTTVNLNGNAAFATDNAAVNNSTNNTVVASNDSHVYNTNNVNSNTGNNSQSFNNGGTNGGGTSMTTGLVTTTVNNTTGGGSNVVSLGSGAGASGAQGVTINEQGNGPFAVSNGSVNNNSSSYVVLSNSAEIKNHNNLNSNTGDNDQSFNNGGNVNLTSGPVSARVTHPNLPQFNVVSTDCGCAMLGNEKIANGNNAAFAVDNAAINNNSNTTVVATNLEDVYNKTNGNQNTGNNSQSFNNAGFSGVMIDPSLTSGPVDQSATNTNGGGSNSYGNGLSLPGAGSVSFTGDWTSVMSAWSMFWSSVL